MLVKICGITSVEDALQALAAGADWIGLNLVSGPRKIDLDRAIEIVQSLDEPSAAAVLWEVKALPWLRDDLRALRDAGVRRVQFYGQVSPKVLTEAASEGFETIVVWHVASQESLSEWDRFLQSCATTRPDYVLFDSRVEGQFGGTGIKADRNVLAATQPSNIRSDQPWVILAGGLTAENVAEAIARVRPFGVDVSSGVESQPGRKDHHQVEAFVRAVRGRCDDREFSVFLA
jgi:phosphoribosylanthranilate isomerase